MRILFSLLGVLVFPGKFAQAKILTCVVLFYFEKALNYIVTELLGGHHHHHNQSFPPQKENTRPPTNESEIQREPEPVQDEDAEKEEEKETEKEEDKGDSHPEAKVTCPCCSEDPVGDLENVQKIAEEMQTKDGQREEGQSYQEDVEDAEHENHSQSDDHHHLMRMSINTALAIALHNLPEGLATFVATLDDPAVGAVLAIAIAIHNIPEGLCVAMPIYYATGNRWKAFMWALFSGIAEPIAALLGWAVLANSFSDRLYGILFGVVSGMMVIISARELLPTAHRYDPEDTVVTYCFMFGMAVMAISLVLFKF